MLETLRTAFRDLLAAMVTLAVRRPGAVVAVAVLLAVAASLYAARNLGIDTRTTEMISAEVPFRHHAIELRRAFPAFDDSIVAVIDGEVPEVVDAAAGMLSERLAQDDVRFSAVRYQAGEPFFATHGLLYLPLDELADLVDRLAAAQPLLGALAADLSLRGLADFAALALDEAGPDAALPEELERLFARMAGVIEAALADEPGQLSWQALMRADAAEDDHRAIVVAEPRIDHANLAPAGEAIRALRAAASELGIGGDEGLELRLTGSAVLNYEELQSVREGAIVAGILATAAVALLLVLGLGSLRLIAATLITLACGLVLTAGFATLAIGRLNLISVTFAVLFVGLGVDFGIHYALRYREAVERGEATAPALTAAALGVGGPLSLSALCAALGFLAFAPTDYRGLAELGVISAAGMAIAWLASLLLMPAVIRLMPYRGVSGRIPRPKIRLPPLERLRAPILGLAAIAGLASALALPHLRFDFNPLHLKDPASESVATFHDLARAARTSPYSIDVLAPDLERARAIALRVEAIDQVARAITLSSFLPEDQEEKLALIDDLAFLIGPIVDPPPEPVALTPDQRRDALVALRESLEGGEGEGGARLAAAVDRFLAASPSAAALADLEARLMGTLPVLFERLRQGLDAGPVGLDDLPASLREAWVNDAGAARVMIQPAAPIVDNDDLETFAEAVLAEVPSATGTPIVISEAGKAVIGAFREASILALVLISIVLALVLRRLSDVVLVLAPLGLAVLLTGANAVLLGLELNFANVIVLPLLLGLGVSGAIHVVMRWRQQAGEGALFQSSTPRAVLFSALTTIASFGSLAVSPHRGMSSMGQLLTIAIVWSLVCTLVVLPSLLSLVGARRANPAASRAHRAENSAREGP